MRRYLWIVITAVFATGCAQVYVPLPPQRSEQPHIVREVLDMTGGRPENTWGGIDAGISKDFIPGADWRWATEHSAFHFKLSELDGWSLEARITAVQAVMDKTGPQKVSFQVNGKTVGAAELKVSRNCDFSFPMDPALLQRSAPVSVTLDASPCLPQEHGPDFCVLLHTIGFVKQEKP
jgi:hypothetical protein